MVLNLILLYDFVFARFSVLLHRLQTKNPRFVNLRFFLAGSKLQCSNKIVTDFEEIIEFYSSLPHELKH